MPTPNSYSLRISSNRSTFILQSNEFLRSGYRPNKSTRLVQKVGHIKLPNWATLEYRNHHSGHLVQTPQALMEWAKENGFLVSFRPKCNNTECTHESCHLKEVEWALDAAVATLRQWRDSGTRDSSNEATADLLWTFPEYLSDQHPMEDIDEEWERPLDRPETTARMIRIFIPGRRPGESSPAFKRRCKAAYDQELKKYESLDPAKTFKNWRLIVNKDSIEYLAMWQAGRTYQEIAEAFSPELRNATAATIIRAIQRVEKGVAKAAEVIGITPRSGEAGYERTVTRNLFSKI